MKLSVGNFTASAFIPPHAAEFQLSKQLDDLEDLIPTLPTVDYSALPNCRKQLIIESPRVVAVSGASTIVAERQA
ncbi:exported hypothetical protein [Candidatus Nitrospira nitrificans]|uniref:Uncharacterized protein n=1 Tax=Candidatus Nitrospira nitrificans TaxID=1742973 RepID=A0A0S4LKJ3_9BACT|nr:exported hypothetical protein [Candidatus Nitrospira nitrificans]